MVTLSVEVIWTTPARNKVEGVVEVIVFVWSRPSVVRRTLQRENMVCEWALHSLLCNDVKSSGHLFDHGVSVNSVENQLK